MGQHLFIESSKSTLEDFVDQDRLADLPFHKVNDNIKEPSAYLATLRFVMGIGKSCSTLVDLIRLHLPNALRVSSSRERRKS